MSKTNAQLVKEKEELLEELYKSGVRVRPSMITKIEDAEKACVEKCKAICEKRDKQIASLIDKRDKQIASLIDKAIKAQQKLIIECENETGRSFRPPVTKAEKTAGTMGISFPGRAFQSGSSNSLREEY
jgi:hypothetical protein